MIAALVARGWLYILGARLRRTTEVRGVGRHLARLECAERNDDCLQWQDFRGAQQRRRRRRQDGPMRRSQITQHGAPARYRGGTHRPIHAGPLSSRGVAVRPWALVRSPVSRRGRCPGSRASCPRNRGRDALDPGVATNRGRHKWDVHPRQTRTASSPAVRVDLAGEGGGESGIAEVFEPPSVRRQVRKPKQS